MTQIGQVPFMRKGLGQRRPPTPIANRPEKAKRPPRGISMLDGTIMPANDFHAVHCSAHQHLPKRRFDECANQVRESIAPEQWRRIRQWIEINVGPRTVTAAREARYVAALVIIAARRLHRQPIEVLDDIANSGTTRGTILPAL